MKQVELTDFKADCLAVIDGVAKTREPIEIVKRGTPLARIVPVPVSNQAEFPQRSLKGTVDIRGDIVAPVFPTNA